MFFNFVQAFSTIANDYEELFISSVVGKLDLVKSWHLKELCNVYNCYVERDLSGMCLWNAYSFYALQNTLMMVTFIVDVCIFPCIQCSVVLFIYCILDWYLYFFFDMSSNTTGFRKRRCQTAIKFAISSFFCIKMIIFIKYILSEWKFINV